MELAPELCCGASSRLQMQQCFGARLQDSVAVGVVDGHEAILRM
jgi:hypothetical protein